MSVEVVDLPGPFGVEVRGVDLRDDLEREVIAQVLQSYDRRHLVLVRGQELTDEQHVRWCRAFGPIAPERNREHGLVSNVEPEGYLREGALPFHSDLAFTDDPVLGISLHALVVPVSGAPTIFADAVGVLDRMSVDLRAQLDGHDVVNVYDFSVAPDRRMREHHLPPGSPVAVRPLVDRHPRTGVPYLTANAMHSDRVVGLPERDSEALLTQLFAAVSSPWNTVTLDWEPGDLVVWDNLSLQHHRPDFPMDEPRTMRRVCLHHRSLLEVIPNMLELSAAPTES